MSHLKRHRLLIAAVLCAGIAVLLGLLAADITSWRSTVARDDLRFRALPGHRALWQPSTVLPGDPASLLLGNGDAVRYRRALQLFWYSRSGSSSEEHPDLPATRAKAQQELEDVIVSGGSASERSNAANLLGVLVATSTPANADPAALMQLLRNAAGHFQRAIAIDPANVDAKQNLELVLRLRRPGKGRLYHDARAGYGFGRGHGASVTGGGY